MPVIIVRHPVLIFYFVAVAVVPGFADFDFVVVPGFADFVADPGFAADPDSAVDPDFVDPGFDFAVVAVAVVAVVSASGHTQDCILSQGLTDFLASAYPALDKGHLNRFCHFQFSFSNAGGIQLIFTRLRPLSIELGCANALRLHVLNHLSPAKHNFFRTPQ